MKKAVLSVLLSCSLERKKFFPMPNMFEVFGFDFMVHTTPSEPDSIKLLEVRALAIYRLDARSTRVFSLLTV